MKKFFALFLSLCLMMSCTTMSAFAAEESSIPTEQVAQISATNSSASVLSTNNYDYWNSHGEVYIDKFSYNIDPLPGENIKIHLYLCSGSVTVKLRNKFGIVRTIATWNTEGHHYADLITNAQRTGYTVILEGPAVADFGIYEEP